MMEYAVSVGALRRVFAARAMLWLGEGAAMLLAWTAVGMRFQVAPVLSLWAIHALLLATQRLRLGSPARDDDAHPGMPAHEVFMHLLADAAILAALVYFSGGIANPLISLLLLPLILCATLLAAAQAWLMTAVVGGLYTLLMFFYQPMQIEVSGAEAINLHLWGMWLSFLFTAVLVAVFVVRLTASLRARDQALAEAREAALRDERLFALGMQAAAAAHDLSTPLATFELTLQELRGEYAGDDELDRPLQVLADQAARMRSVLGTLRALAGSGRMQSGRVLPADAWLRGVLEQWQQMRPQAVLQAHLPAEGPAPGIRDEPMLVAAFLTLLNNAADASPETIEVEADWHGAELRLRVLDRGPGRTDQLNPGLSSKPDGWGVGLQLAEAGMSRLAGTLCLTQRKGGGVVAELAVPMAALQKGNGA